jgi:hypothetical protein
MVDLVYSISMELAAYFTSKNITCIEEYLLLEMANPMQKSRHISFFKFPFYVLSDLYIKISFL